MYQLYIDEEKLELKVTPLKAAYKNEKKLIEFLKNTPNDIYYWNDNIRLCGKRTPLIELARTTKDGWLVQARERMQKIEEIKI